MSSPPVRRWWWTPAIWPVVDATCSIDIQTVKGVKNVLFGGEGLFNTVVTGPGKIILQTMPVSGVAAALAPFFPSGS